MMRSLAVAMLAFCLCDEPSRAQAVQAEAGKIASLEVDAHGSKDRKELTFEVVSIKPAAEGEQGDWQNLPDGYLRTNVSMSTLIQMAFFPAVLWSPDRLRNAPDWVRTERYDFLGKVSPEDVAEWQKQAESMLDNKAVQSALQAALKERCGLIARRIPAEVTGYDLVVGKKGPHLRLTQPDEVFPPDVPLHADGTRSGFLQDMKTNSAKLAYYNVTMDQFAASFSSVTGKPMRNRTELPGRYDIVLNDVLPIVGNAPGLAASLKPAERYDLNSFGLRLKETMLPASDLVIDHIERPTPN